MILFTDIHGCFLTFKALLAQVRKEYPEDEVCILGDMVDRGPRSAQVIEFIKGQKFHAVQGNHEDLMLKATDPGTGKLISVFNSWTRNGGNETLESYKEHGYEGNQISLQHRYWVEQLPLYLEFEQDDKKLFVSHAAVKGSVPRAIANLEPPERWSDSSKLSDSILWWRGDPTHLYGDKMFQVFGHTPAREPRITKDFAMIDTGAAYAHGGYGKLIALQWPDMKVFQQDNID